MLAKITRQRQLDGLEIGNSNDCRHGFTTTSDVLVTLRAKKHVLEDGIVILSNHDGKMRDLLR